MPRESLGQSGEGVEKSRIGGELPIGEFGSMLGHWWLAGENSQANRAGGHGRQSKTRWAGGISLGCQVLDVTSQE